MKNTRRVISIPSVKHTKSSAYQVISMPSHKDLGVKTKADPMVRWVRRLARLRGQAHRCRPNTPTVADQIRPQLPAINRPRWASVCLLKSVSHSCNLTMVVISLCPMYNECLGDVSRTNSFSGEDRPGRTATVNKTTSGTTLPGTWQFVGFWRWNAGGLI